MHILLCHVKFFECKFFEGLYFGSICSGGFEFFPSNECICQKKKMGKSLKRFHSISK